MRETQRQRGYIDGHSFYENGHIHHLKKKPRHLTLVPNVKAGLLIGLPWGWRWIF